MSHIITHDLRFELKPNETLLEGLERTGHAVEYQCREGFCGACRIPILEGQVSYQSAPLAFIGAGEVLPCCARPQGDLVLALDTEKLKKRA